jgi:DNA-binding NarL/FixJ family response regulator
MQCIALYSKSILATCNYLRQQNSSVKVMASKTKQKENDAMRKRKVVTSLYYYSDLSVRNIAQQVELPIRDD